jgi:hypothetical protein
MQTSSIKFGHFAREALKKATAEERICDVEVGEERTY